MLHVGTCFSWKLDLHLCICSLVNTSCTLSSQHPHQALKVVTVSHEPCNNLS